MSSLSKPPRPGRPLTLRGKPRRRAVVIAAVQIVLGAATALTGIHPALAQPTAASVSYDIAPGPLSEALATFAAQSGVSISMETAQLRNVRSNGLRGRYAVDDGFRELVKNTGYRIGRTPAGYVVLPDAASTGATAQLTSAPANPGDMALPLVTVAGQGDAPAQDGMVALRASGGSKTDTPLSEVPQSISVVTSEQMEWQGVQKMEQALRYEAGVRTELADDLRHQNIQIRGFSVAASNQGIYLDGLALPTRYYGSYDINPYSLDRIEVIRGPASVLYGQNVPGGIVNQISKRPTETPIREVEVTTGYPARIQGAFDFGGALDKDGKVLYRLNGMLRDADTQVDFVKDKRFYIAPSLTWKMTPDTTLTFMASYQQIRAGSTDQWLPSDGTLTATPYGKIRPSFFSGEPGFDKYDKNQAMIGYAFEHRFNDQLAFRQNARFSEITTDYQALITELGWATDAAGNPDYTRLQRYAFSSREHAHTFAIDNQLEYKMSHGIVDQTWLAGVDYQTSAFNTQLGIDFDVPSINPFAPVYGNVIASPPTYSSTYQKLRQLGLYLQDQIKIDRHWILTLGGRFDTATVSTDNLLGGTTTSQDDHAFTYRAGLAYQTDAGVTPYFAYSTSFRPVIGTSFSGDPFVPTKGKQAELGVKYQPRGSNSYITAALFDLRQTNVQTRDPNNPNFQVQTGEIRSRGLELQGKLEVTRSLDILASYTLTDLEVTKSNTDNLGKVPFAGVPRHMASLWANYTMRDGVLNGLGFGAGARYIGATTDDGIGQTFVPPAWLFDAAIRYDLAKLDASLKGATFELNASNLFNKTYVASCNNTNLCFYGPRRVVLATGRYRW